MSCEINLRTHTTKEHTEALSLSLCVTLCLCLYYISLFLSPYLSFCSYASLSVCLYLPFSASVSTLSLSFCFSSSLSLPLSVRLCASLSISFYLSLSLSLCHDVYVIRWCDGPSWVADRRPVESYGAVSEAERKRRCPSCDPWFRTDRIVHHAWRPPGAQSEAAARGGRHPHR